MISQKIFFSPLEQFSLKMLSDQVAPGLIAFTNASLYLLIVLVLIFSFFYLSLKRATLIPSTVQLLAESVYNFVLTTVVQQAGPKALRYFPLFFTIFVIILFSNLVGLLPFAFAPTSHLVFTFSFALTCNLAFIIIGFKENGLSFLKLFAPKGSPVFLLPLIIVIEFMSYLLRTFSLSIRLFANIMAGHTLLHILASFVIAFINTDAVSLALLPFALVLAVVVLEIGIAFLQAYVFLILLSIYFERFFSSTLVLKNLDLGNLIFFFRHLAELVDAPDLKSGSFQSAGSSP